MFIKNLYKAWEYFQEFILFLRIYSLCFFSLFISAAHFYLTFHESKYISVALLFYKIKVSIKC